MKNVFDGKQWIFKELATNKPNISGGIYKDKRPSGSQKEDIVINSLTMTNDYLQDQVLNVNCYVPYQSVKIDVTSQFMPNEKRMKEITEQVYPLLNDVFRDDFNCTIVNHTTFEEEADKANYINFRVNLKAYPTI